ncbi:endonuclease domain-containing protein [Pseudactinotalea terrae]|uniref:endonuclease domain-containing protein n=1 Tax=Pseudactinotalea terrae TaxID=1743262 RepID=UPI0012E24AB6|nr:DUF559 domain-containing protein [Pseudactinotalea terrae]
MPPLPRLVRRGQSYLSPSTVSRLATAGELVGVLPGTYLRADVAANPFWRAAAAAAWRPDAILFGSIAASLTFWRELPVSQIDVACETTLQRPGYRFERRAIPSDLVINRGESLLTHPALTALDLAVPTDGDAIDNVLRSKMVRISDLQEALAATPYRRGNRARRRLLLDSRAEPWSTAERLAHKILHAAGITGWCANEPIALDGHEYFLDIAFKGIKLVIEVDGYEFHTDRTVFESDRDRQNSLQLARWTVLRYTYRRLRDDPDNVLRQIRAGIELARHRTELESLGRIPRSMA